MLNQSYYSWQNTMQSIIQEFYVDIKDHPALAHAHIVHTPLKQKRGCDRKHRCNLPKSELEQFERPANEDDDGYDPYSDRPAMPESFEQDPWK